MGWHQKAFFFLPSQTKLLKRCWRVSGLCCLTIFPVCGGTFHHVGNRILRRHADRLGYPKDFTILDREDAEDLISASLGEAGVDPKDKRFPKAQVLAEIFSLAANHRTNCGSILKSQFGYFTEFESWITKVGEIYLRRKRTVPRWTMTIS